MNTQQQDALLIVAKISLESLPESGKIAAFMHLDKTIQEKIVAGALANMSPENRRAILFAYPESSATFTSQAAVSALEKLNQDLAFFLATYKIKAIAGEPSQVAQTIPTNKTYAQYLMEGQVLSIALHEAYPDRYKAEQAFGLRS